MSATLGMTDPWGKRVRVPIHPDTYGWRVYAAGYTIAYPALIILADSWETAWEVWCEQQTAYPMESDPETMAALQAGEMVEGLEWADGVGYVATDDLVLQELRG